MNAPRIEIKICGLTSPELAIACAAAGAASISRNSRLGIKVFMCVLGPVVLPVKIAYALKNGRVLAILGCMIGSHGIFCPKGKSVLYGLSQVPPAKAGGLEFGISRLAFLAHAYAWVRWRQSMHMRIPARRS